MHIPRIYQDDSLAQGQSLLLSEAAAHHVVNVLRMKAGQPLILFNGQGGYFNATINRIDKRQVETTVENYHDEECESSLNIILAQGISRGQRMDYTLQKAVEMGVTKIAPVICQHGNVKLDKKLKDKRLEHWQKIIIGACEQSGRNRIPSISSPVRFDEWVTDENKGLKILLHPAGQWKLRQLKPVDNNVVMLAGPEGGFSNAEVYSAEKNGYQSVALGPRTLRTETTPLAAITACQVLWGDLN